MIRSSIALSLLAAGVPAGQSRARPTPAQRALQDLGVGMFVHFAPNTWQD
jgi:alpha-L-fucosidase